MQTEKELSDRLRRGDSSVIRELWSLYSRRLAAVISRYVDEESLKDVLQETFIKLLNKGSQFKYLRPGSLYSWICRIAVNEALQSLRQGRKMEFTELDFDLPQEEEEADVRGIPPEKLIEMIRSLPPGYRAVLNLYVFEDKSHKEIARELGIKENSSASQYLRAKAALARMIKDYNKSLE